MVYTIFLEGLSFKGYHGVLPEERKRGQQFLVDVELVLPDFLWPGEDDLRETVDYSAVYQTVKMAVEGEAVNLLETLGERVAAALFARYPAEEVILSIRKPEAPLGEEKGRAGVRLKVQRREWEARESQKNKARASLKEGPGREAKEKDRGQAEQVRAYIGLGSNLGDKRAFLRQALGLLAVHPRVCLEKVSSFYETRPVGVSPELPFINAVAEISTSLSAEELLALLRKIEEELGRSRPYPGAPRTIDLDLLLYGEEQIALPHLVVPHPRLPERDFVLAPLLEIAPEVRLPSGKTAKELLAELQKEGSNLLSKLPGHVTI